MEDDGESNPQRPRVLCVDDDPRLLRGLARSLRHTCSVVCADSAEAALRLLDTDAEFDLLLTDMRMPDLTGAQLCVEARQRRPRLVRVILTGYSDPESTRLAAAEGEVFRFLTKPCSRELLQATIREGMAQRAARP